MLFFLHFLPSFHSGFFSRIHAILEALYFHPSCYPSALLFLLPRLTQKHSDTKIHLWRQAVVCVPSFKRRFQIAGLIQVSQGPMERGCEIPSDLTMSRIRRFCCRKSKMFFASNRCFLSISEPSSAGKTASTLLMMSDPKYEIFFKYIEGTGWQDILFSEEARTGPLDI